MCFVCVFAVCVCVYICLCVCVCGGVIFMYVVKCVLVCVVCVFVVGGGLFACKCVWMCVSKGGLCVLCLHVHTLCLCVCLCVRYHELSCIHGPAELDSDPLFL